MQYAEYVYLLNNISPTRFDDTKSWFLILNILKSSRVPFHIFNSFSSKSEKYTNENECLEHWNNYIIKEDIDQKLSISTLFDWFKEDNEKKFFKYQNLFKKCYQVANDLSISEYYSELIKNNDELSKYHYKPSTDEWFYLTENNIWSRIDKRHPVLFKTEIGKVLEGIIERKMNYFRHKKNELESKEEEEENAQISMPGEYREKERKTL